MVLCVAGLGESHVDHLMGDLIAPFVIFTVGILAALNQVQVIVAAKGEDEARIEALLAPHVSGFGKTS